MLLSLCACTVMAYCQQDQHDSSSSANSWFRLSGDASVFGEKYNASEAVQMRRPMQTGRILLHPTITLWNTIVLPFELYLSNETSSFQQPFNNFGISARIGESVTLFGGYHSLAISQLTSGDRRVFGAGADLRLGNFRVAVTGGLTQAAVRPDSASYQAGVYAQYLAAGKISLDVKDGFAIGINTLFSKDEERSLTERPAGVSPQENLVISLDTRIPISSAVRFDAEVGGSFHTRDLFAEKIQVEGIPSLFPALHISSHIDAAAVAALSYSSNALSLKLRSEYTGPGFVTFGYPQMIADRLRADLAPSFTLFEQKVRINGSLGLEWNNLAKNLNGLTQRITGSANVSAQLYDWLGMDALYQNYGTRLNSTNDTLRVQNVFSMVMITPRLTFQSGGWQHFLTLNFSNQNYSDDNLLTKQYSENRSTTILGFWNSIKDDLSLSLSCSGMNTTTALLTLRGTDLTMTGAYRLFDGVVYPALTITEAWYDASGGIQAKSSALLRTTCRVSSHSDVVVLLQFNHYTYAPGVVSRNYNESQSSIEFRQSF